MHCPTLEEITTATLSLLPRGRAWQTNEGLPRQGYDPAFNPEAFNPEAFATTSLRKSILWQYWRSFAVVAHYLTERLCALRLEFWCATHSETHDGWLKEYGLPDECDPFPDLCTKVSALGGTRCEYYAEIAARMGWTISCEEISINCGSRIGCSRAGTARAGGRLGRAMLRIVVHLDESPAVAVNAHKAPRAGRMRTGRRLSCGPNFNGLKCLLTRIIHADIFTIYEGR